MSQKVFDTIKSFEKDEISSALMLLKHRCGELGLFKTMHALEPATQAVGYELAEHIESKTQISKKEEIARRKRQREFDANALHDKFDGNGRDRKNGGFCS